ncbi:hypothetical protein F5J12DRAFT_786305 [Pisolithus orientalis]|uniref:uncharacterized protein n=1 Tax=Pisolithus orientalis TaxID=936130 RepID=UPI002224A458|nr:uncharacterized protein F5J12DRAFT_786305 [Pisolithus orientalis]KAI5991761.1 hypothetical protein F5J12DRAFT_786305 [Pisolithus orientalis]
MLISSPFNLKAINKEIWCHFWAIEPEQVGLIQFGGVVRGVDYNYQTTPNDMTSPLVHRSVEPVRTLGDAQGHINDVSDMPSRAVIQPVCELGSMLQGCAPDPPAVTGVDSVAHADSNEFVKPQLPACSNVLLVLTSVLLDQNRWPAWMHNEPKVKTKNENKHSPKVLWSDLIKNNKELRKVIPQWFGNPAVTDENDQPGIMNHGQSISDTSVLRLTAEVKEKWKVPTPCKSVIEHPVEVHTLDSVLEQEEQMKTPKYMIKKLKEASLVEWLDSAKALIHEQQAIIDSFNCHNKYESMNLGQSGLSAEQKESMAQVGNSLGRVEISNTHAIRNYTTLSIKPMKQSGSPAAVNAKKTH